MSEGGGLLEVIMLHIRPGVRLHSTASLRGSPPPLLCLGAPCCSRPCMSLLQTALLLESSFFMVSCFCSRIVSLPCFCCQIPHHGDRDRHSLAPASLSKPNLPHEHEVLKKKQTTCFLENLKYSFCCFHSFIQEA